MKAIISVSVAMEFEGKDLNEIKNKFENYNFPKEMEYIETLTIEDAETRDDLVDEWDELY